MPTESSALWDDEPVELTRARRLFQFLKAFAERTVPPARTIAQHPWSMVLSELPEHPSIQLGEVRLGAAATEDAPVPAPAPLLRVVRPTLTPAPKPPHVLMPFLQPTWESATGAVQLKYAVNVVRYGETVTETFDEDMDRVSALARWSAEWEAWAEAERPALAAMRVFERLYELRGLIEREGERLELVLGDGRLRWRHVSGAIDHPVLLQRVELQFDAHAPALELVDAERPPELYSAVISEGTALTPVQLTSLREELERGGYHPLAKEATSAYLRRLVQLLSPLGRFSAEPAAGHAGAEPVLARDAVLFVRARPSGFAAAFDRVLQDLESKGSLPTSLTRLVGVERPLPALAEEDDHSPWGEPQDVLLSKPANSEQVQMARALDRHRAVLVQGPPGTGKSHTIANLIGHLVAQGKRVLVTSHTTKALRVLREHVVEPLQPLCVSLLDSDAESRAQLEQSVRGILARLTTAREEELTREVAAIEAERSRLNEETRRITDDLRTIRESEYRPLVFGGSALPPSDAAREVRDHAEENDWIPGPLEAGAPPPLSDAEVRELYRSNVEMSAAEEQQIAGALPDLDRLPTPQEFAELTDRLNAAEPSELRLLWNRAASPRLIPDLERLVTLSQELAVDLESRTPWERTLLAAGHEGGSEAKVWLELRGMVDELVAEWQTSRALLLAQSVIVNGDTDQEDLLREVRLIVAHLSSGKRLGALLLLWRTPWKRAVAAARVNGSRPSALVQFQAIQSHLTLILARSRLRQRWARQAEPIGLPAFETLAEPIEPVLRQYADRFAELIAWWEVRSTPLYNLMGSTGFEWDELRSRELARTGPKTPFELAVHVLGTPLAAAASARLAAARNVETEEQLGGLAQELRGYQGAICSTLLAAVRDRDAVTYEAAHQNLSALLRKSHQGERRVELLERLERVAPTWAGQIRRREGRHGKPQPAGEPARAWRWRQIQQEIQRRAELNEVRLGRELKDRQAALRRATTDLIDRRAWLAQLRRTDLSARLALQGWADTVRRIGRGTGVRVPQLQAEARKLLTKARDAVPVWIMPLSRVAESFDPLDGKFDVVIVDEASQADVTGLLAWYLGESVAVVGDHEQVSPLAVGQDLTQVTQLISDHLQGIPNSHLYDGKASIYDLARQCFGGTIALREHFRCVPELIGFSDELCYDFEIRPLRPARSAARPHVVEYVVAGGPSPQRDGKTNLSEARSIVSLLKAATELREYDGKTMGVITLLGDEQAYLIQDLAVKVVGAVELDRRRFLAGNAAHFQGDERHVVFLSMVDVSAGDGPLRLIGGHDLRFKQRYNVASSRAKDQLWLVHSLDPDRDLQDGDLRRRLIDYVREPGARRGAREEVRQRTGSEFEKAVADRLVAAGYRVQPQYRVGSYRIDLVVSDDSGEVAIECDGDRYHDLNQIPLDMARQAVLERAGWRFVRIRGTRFYRDPDVTMEWVLAELAKLGVGSTAPSTGETATEREGIELKERVVRRAHEIMRELAWVEDVAGERVVSPRALMRPAGLARTAKPRAGGQAGA